MTNFVKFPFFEVVNMLMSTVDINPSLRGTATGVVFTTVTLPVTNFRYRQSMNLDWTFADLYQAYVPTVRSFSETCTATKEQMLRSFWETFTATKEQKPVSTNREC